MRFYVILFALTSCPALCDVVTTIAPVSVSDFVDLLKQNLRRNNDDYIESTTVSVSVPNPYLIETSTPAEVPRNDTGPNQILPKSKKIFYKAAPLNGNSLYVDIKNISGAQRRVYNALEVKTSEVQSAEINATKKQITATLSNATKKFRPFMTRNIPNKTIRFTKTLPKTISANNFKNALKFNRSKLNAGASFRSRNHHDEKIQKLNDIKTFIDRNRQLFDDFMKKKREEALKAMGSHKVITQNTGKAPRAEKAAKAVRKPSVDEAEPESELARKMVGRFRMRARSEEEEEIQPEQLDMAPARGGHIQAYRSRGRLCQRNVLVPEGPKYNSRGVIYLAAYGHHAGRDFTHTRRPKLLLPRCCNCCKKSLLGCE